MIFGKVKMLGVLFGIWVLAACYKANNVPPPNDPPVYDIWVGNVGRIDDSRIDTVRLVDGHEGSPMWLGLQSGNPTGYIFKCYFSDLPDCIKPSFDTINVGLSHERWLSFTSTCDTGYYTGNFNVYCQQFGLKSYPIRFHVR